MEPVDLTNLRSMTDGDNEIEKALFEEFYASFEKGIQVLQKNFGAGEAEIWRKEAHALKGIALNLGAGDLGIFCKQAQDKHLADSSLKQALIAHMENEYGRVKQFLQKLP